jgi:hypothetical protein
MDANEMVYRFDILYDKIASGSSPGYTNREKSVFLTKAQGVLVDKYQSLEGDESRRVNLSNIKKTIEITTPSAIQGAGKPFGYRYDLPSDYLHPLSEEVTVVSLNECLNGNRVRVVPKREDEYSIQIHNPLKRPSVIGSAGDLVWRLFSGDDGTNNRVDIITDGTFTISSYFLTYYRQSADIIPVTAGDPSTTVRSDSEVNSSCHEEIVEIAVRIASGVATPQDYQIALNEEKINN